MQNNRKQNITLQILEKLKYAKAADKLAKLKNGVSTINNYMNTPNNLKGVTANNVMQPTQNTLQQTTPTLQNGATSLANGFTPHTMPTINNFSAGANTLGNTTALNAGAGLSNASGLSPVGTAIASEASGAGGTGLASLGNIGANVATTAGGEALAGAGAGTGAALGGSTAAGAAGGLGAAGLGTGLASMAGAAMPILGAGLLAYQLFNAVKSEKDAEKQEKMQQLMQINQQAANSDTENAMKNLKQQELMSMVNQGYTGQLPQLPNTTMQQPQQPTQYAMPNNTTGAAANITDGLNTANDSAGLISSLVDAVKGGESMPIIDTPEQTQNVQTGQVDQLQDNRNLRQKFGNFLQDAGKGFNENNTTTISPENFGQNTYATQTVRELPHDEQVGAFADELARKGVKEDVINAYLQNGRNSGNKEIADWVNAHQDLRNEDGSWKPSQVTETQEHKKGIGYRIGEGLGTLNRIASNPATQGLASTALNLMDGRSLGYSLGKGMEYGANKARSDAYRKLITGDDGASLFGGYTDKDLNAYTNQLYKDNMSRYYQQKGETDKQRANTDKKYKEGMLNVNQQKANTDAKYKEGMLNINQQKVDVSRVSNTIKQMGINLKVNQLNDKNKKAQQLGKDFSFYLTKISDPNTSTEQKQFLEKQMVADYQGDFYKLLGAYNKAHKGQ